MPKEHQMSLATVLNRQLASVIDKDLFRSAEGDIELLQKLPVLVRRVCQLKLVDAN